MSRPLSSTGIDVKHEFSVFSDGAAPLFRQAPHVVDQSDQVILVNSYPLFFHTVFEAERAEALVCLHVVQNLPAVFKPDHLVVSVSVLVARCPYSGGKVVQQHDQLLRFNEAGRVRIPYFFHCPKALAHCLTPFLPLRLGNSESAGCVLIRRHRDGSTGSEVVRPVRRFRNPPWYESCPYRNSRASIASAWYASVWFTNGSCRSNASNALHGGSLSFLSSFALMSSGKSSGAVGKRKSRALFLWFSGWPSTNWPLSALLPRSNQ